MQQATPVSALPSLAELAELDALELEETLTALWVDAREAQAVPDAVRMHLRGLTALAVASGAQGSHAMMEAIASAVAQGHDAKARHADTLAEIHRIVGYAHWKRAQAICAKSYHLAISVSVGKPGARQALRAYLRKQLALVRKVRSEVWRNSGTNLACRNAYVSLRMQVRGLQAAKRRATVCEAAPVEHKLVAWAERQGAHGSAGMHFIPPATDYSMGISYVVHNAIAQETPKGLHKHWIPAQLRPYGEVAMPNSREEGSEAGILPFAAKPVVKYRRKRKAFEQV